MTERPILFSGEMVRAILAGRKTQTRRVVKPQPPQPEDVRAKAGVDFSVFTGRSGTFRVAGPVWAVRDLMGCEPRWRCPYGVPGDRLWVRETFYCDDGSYPDGDRASMLRLMEYRADHDCASWEAGCPCDDGEGRSSWRPSIHMPRWASRLTLRVTDVRVERVQDISEEDARAEGVGCQSLGARALFADLWDDINGPRGFGWAANPWVWVVSFEVER